MKAFLLVFSLKTNDEVEKNCNTHHTELNILEQQLVDMKKTLSQKYEN